MLILSLIILKEIPNWNLYVALAIMLVGTVLIVIDTLENDCLLKVENVVYFDDEYVFEENEDGESISIVLQSKIRM